MIIQIDSREKPKAIGGILKYFDRNGIQHFSSKLYVGDYMNLDNPRLIIDRKQNLTELCGNVCQQHERFRNEIQRASESGIQLIILCEHGRGICSLEDVIFWENPRRHMRVDTPAGWQTVETNAMRGETLYKILNTMSRKYGIRFEFCDKQNTGKRIVELLT